jgi:signal transduction histidine kinase
MCADHDQRAGPADTGGRETVDIPRQQVAREADSRCGGALTFPDVSRLELDVLLVQLVKRAQEVTSTQGRLRGLLHANQTILGDLSVPVLLRRILDAARELVGARYAALGVIGADGHLAQFVHAGMPAELVERIGRLPQGKGLLGALIDDPVPIRLTVLGEDSRSVGFPPGHPHMDSFLGVPIRVRDQVFGNLYLAQSTNGMFSAEDEQLATALAATAGTAIDNARLYEAARARQEWLRASAALTRHLLSPEPDLDDAAGTNSRPLQMIAELCREIAAADLVTVVMPAEDGRELHVEVAVGSVATRGTEQLLGTTVPLAQTLAGRVFTSGEPLRVAHPGELDGLTLAVSGEVDIGPVLVMPLQGSRRMHGVLTAARMRGATAFTAEDLEMAAGFANQASVAIELAEARSDQQRATMLDERDRIAADLHDHVIQRLFATGLSLQSTLARLTPGTVSERIDAAITSLDDTISQIRTSIFQLHQQPSTQPAGVRTRLLAVVTDLTPALGFEAGVRFSGVFEDLIPESAVEDLLAVLREALSNVAQHAHAQTATITASTTGGQLSLSVADDGTGIGPATRRSGLANLRHRAEHHGGTLTFEPVQPSGTQLTWTVPLR